MTRAGSLLCSGSVIAGLIFIQATAANAQVAEIETEAEPDSSPPSQVPEQGIQEIVVTAQKFEQSLQRTPAAVTAIDTETLVSAGVVDIRAAQNLVPSVRFQQEGASTEVYIRGVGATLDLAHIEPPTSVNFEGVYIPREATSIPFFDLNRIEVLPGPQGTLYGRSTMGGAVNIYFNRPTDEFETRGLIEVGNYDLVHVSLAQNLPVSNDFAVRIAGDYNYHDGYQTSGADSRDDFGVRLSALYDPSPAFSAYVWGYYADRGGKTPNIVNRGLDGDTLLPREGAYLTDNPYNDFIPPQFAFFGQVEARPFYYESGAGGAEITIDVGGPTLTYIPSYLHHSNASRYFITGLPTLLTVKYDQHTQELRLADDRGPIQWIAGLYAYRLVSSGNVNVAGTNSSNIDRNRLQGIAAFGQATIDVSDAFRVTAGGRVSFDDREGRGRTLDALGQPTIPFTSSISPSHVDFKIGVEYDVAPRAMVYAVVQSGYQPGTFNEVPNTPTFSNTVQSPSLIAYTGGIKTRFLENTLQVNSEFFYYDYSDLFAQSFNANAGFNQIFNAQKVEIYGNQTDILFEPSPQDRFNLSIGYLHAENRRFITPSGQNFAGLSLQYSPKWTVTAGYQHDFNIGDGYLRARAETRLESHFYGDFLHSFGTRQSGYMKSDASLTYYSGDDRWSLGAWIKNIEDEAVQAATASGGLPGPAASFLEPPRTYGLRAAFNF